MSPDESPLFYRDIGLGLIFLPAAIFLALLVAGLKFNALFWICTGVVLVCLNCATKRSVLFAALFGMLAIRFAFGSLIFKSLTMLLGAVGFAAIALTMAFWDRRGYPDDHKASSNI